MNHELEQEGAAFAARQEKLRARLRRDVAAALAEHRQLSNELVALAPGGGGGPS